MTVSAEFPGRLPALHLVADSAQLRLADFETRVRALAEAGGPRIAIHLRGHELTAAELYRRAELCRDIFSATGTWLVVNDRVDIALAVGADAVQLGERSLEPGEARGILGDPVAIGASVHDLAGARAAKSGGADFLLVGTIYPSASHPERAAAGVELLRRMGEIELPRIAIGGIDAGRVREVLDAGAAGVAVISAVWKAPEPVAALAELIQRLEG